MIPEYFVIVGAVISAFGGMSYLLDTLKGRVKPNKVTFFLWAVAPLIAFVAELQKGVGIQSLMTFMVGFIPLSIFLASFLNKKADWKITRFDLSCGAISVLGIISWLITQEGNVAIFFGILADGFASIPTIVKAYRFPETETVWPYTSAMINGIITLLTIATWNFANYGFPLYIVVNCFIITFLVWSKIGKGLSEKKVT